MSSRRPAVVSLSNHAAASGAFQPSFDRLRTVSSVLWHDSEDASRFADCEY
jgi:hypothetical protein